MSVCTHGPHQTETAALATVLIMNGPNEQDKFLGLCLNSSLEDLQVWLQERPQFKVSQPEATTGKYNIEKQFGKCHKFN